MVFTSSTPQGATALLEVEPGLQPYATCPLCRTTNTSLSWHALSAGGAWRCVRCGQHWDATRLAAVAEYEAWALNHDSRLQAHHAAGTDASTPPHDNTARKNGPQENGEAISRWDNEGGRPSGLRHRR